MFKKCNEGNPKPRSCSSTYTTSRRPRYQAKSYDLKRDKKWSDVGEHRLLDRASHKLSETATRFSIVENGA